MAYPMPPTVIIIHFDKQISEQPLIYDRSGILEALAGKLEINISGSGSFSKTVPIPVKVYPVSDFADGVTPKGTAGISSYIFLKEKAGSSMKHTLERAHFTLQHQCLTPLVPEW
jgi:hypothetical protein